MSTDVATARAKLLDIVKAKAIVHGKVTLSSGREADYYVDLRRISLDGEAAPLVGIVMRDLTKDLDYEAAGGLTLGADPVATAMMHAPGQPLNAFVVRKEAKAHGMQRRIEGPDVRGRRVVVVEDTTTTGASPLQAVEALREIGAEVVGVATIVDRGTGADRVIGPIFFTRKKTQIVSSSRSVPPRPCSARTYGVAPGVVFGGRDIVVIAGPCSVESEQQILTSAHAVRAAGASALRGGAFKPRSSPYSFQGMGKKGLQLLAKAREETGLAIVTEAMDEEGANLVAEYADCIQIGARNMQNYSLLRAIGKLGKPVLLKRGMAAGFAGIENMLFHAPGTSMLFGDAKTSLTKLVTEVKSA